MPTNQRRFNQNLLIHYLQWIPVKSLLSVLCGTFSELGGEKVLRCSSDKVPVTGRRNGRHILHRAYADRVQIKDRIPDDVVGFRLLRKGHHNSSGPNNPSLLPRNLANRISQELLMIERNV